MNHALRGRITTPKMSTSQSLSQESVTVFPEVLKGHADVVKIKDLETGRLSCIIRVGPL